MKKQRKNHSYISSYIVLAILVAAVGFTFFSISNTLDSFTTTISARTNSSSAILASANPETDVTIQMPVTYYDQKADECINLYDLNLSDEAKMRQFEWSSCGFYGTGLEQGLVESKLDDNYLPVATEASSETTGRGITTNNFRRWFHTVSDQSKLYASTITLNYAAESQTYSFANEHFYPVDDCNFSVDDTVNEDGHNHLFTMNLNIPFVAQLSNTEKFTITADDDTWVFVNNQLILDMGGIHGAMTASFRIDYEGLVYYSVNGAEETRIDLGLAKQEGAVIRIYHADRDSMNSTFALTTENMYLDIVNTSIASTEDAETLAYNPEDPMYVAPLGESQTTEPNHDRALLASIIAQFSILAVLLMLSPILVRFAIDRHNK